MEKLKYNYEEFLAFVLIYVGHIDMEFSEEEKTIVKRLVSEEDYTEILNDFVNMSDYSALQTIINYKGVYYPTVDQKRELMSKVKDMCFADGSFTSIEKEVLMFLDKML